jgi:hypothetical protein
LWNIDENFDTPNDAVNATLVTGTTYTATVSGLTANTDYYFKSQATNTTSQVNTQTSIASAAIKTLSASSPPSGPPSVPTLAADGATSTSLTVTFSVTGITGTAPLTYNLLWSIVSDFSGDPNEPVVATRVGESSNYTATVGSLTANTNYYFKSQATNGSGTETSSVSAAIITRPTIPLAPTLVQDSATSDSLTVTFDAVSDDGDSIPTYSIYYGEASDSLISFVTPSQVDQSTIYEAEVTGLDPNTDYYFQARATNASGTSASISVGGPFRTLTTFVPVVEPSNPTYVSKTDVSITVENNDQYNTAAQPPPTTPFTYTVSYTADSANPNSWIAMSISSGPNPDTGKDTGSGYTRYTVSDLLNGTQYFIKTAVYNNSTPTYNTQTSTTLPVTTLIPVVTPTAPTMDGQPTTSSITVRNNDENNRSPNRNSTTPLAYTVYYSETNTDEGQWTLVDKDGNDPDTGNGDTTYTQSGLSSGTTYYFRTTVSNINGTRSSNSSPIGIPTASNPPPSFVPVVIPSQAVENTTTATSITIANFDHNNIDNNSTTPLTYVVEYAANAVQGPWYPLDPVPDETDTGDGSKQYTATGLDPATTYAFRITVSNIDGTTTYQEDSTVNFTTEAAIPVQAPSPPTFDSKTTNSITVKNVDGNNGMATPPLTYTVSYSLDGGSTWTPFTAISGDTGTNNTTYTLNSETAGGPITANTPYSFKTSVSNSGGTAESATTTTISTRPEPVTYTSNDNPQTISPGPYTIPTGFTMIQFQLVGAGGGAGTGGGGGGGGYVYSGNNTSGTGEPSAISIPSGYTSIAVTFGPTSDTVLTFGGDSESLLATAEVGGDGGESNGGAAGGAGSVSITPYSSASGTVGASAAEGGLGGPGGYTGSGEANTFGHGADSNGQNRTGGYYSVTLS